MIKIVIIAVVINSSSSAIEQQESTGGDAANYNNRTYRIEKTTRTEYTASLLSNVFISTLPFADQMYRSTLFCTRYAQCANVLCWLSTLLDLVERYASLHK